MKEGITLWVIQKKIKKGDYDYALVPDHPNATKNGYVLYHRIVVENHIGRLLTQDEVVHHKDHNKKNNCIDNLEITSQQEHARSHGFERMRNYVLLKCPWCEKVFEKPKNGTHLQSSSQYTCCCRSCRGKFSRYSQLNGKDEWWNKRVEENVIEEYRKRSDL